jgi:hypothetical protein
LCNNGPEAIILFNAVPKKNTQLRSKMRPIQKKDCKVEAKVEVEVEGK